MLLTMVISIYLFNFKPTVQVCVHSITLILLTLQGAHVYVDHFGVMFVDLNASEREIGFQMDEWAVGNSTWLMIHNRYGNLVSVPAYFGDADPYTVSPGLCGLEWTCEFLARNIASLLCTILS